MSDAPVDGPGEWISITDAAARLSEIGDVVDRSTLSRYISQHAEALPTRRDGKANLVEFGALAQHRAENIRLKPRTPASPAGAGRPGGDIRASTRPGRFAGTQSDGLARKAAADAEMREMDLAERRGELTPTAEVEHAGREAIALMQAEFEKVVEAEAAMLSVRYGWDERITRIALKAFARHGIEVFNRKIRDRLETRQSAAMLAIADGVDQPQAIAGAVAGSA